MQIVLQVKAIRTDARKLWISLFLLVSACIYIVLEEKKKNIVPVFALTVFLLVVLGCYYLGDEVISNYDKTKTTGTIVGFEEIHNGDEIEQWSVIEFTVGEERYQDDYPMLEGASGQTTEKFFSLNDIDPTVFIDDDGRRWSFYQSSGYCGLYL